MQAEAESLCAQTNPNHAQKSTFVDSRAEIVTAKRIPVLDGIRALAIGLVILSHIFLTRPGLAVLGPFGVSVFLVLSGYLITGVMLQDEQCNGSLRLGRFYWRRAWRILPALYTYLATIFLLSNFHVIQRPNHTEWLASLCFLRNVLSGGNWQTGHLWSLSLEEQFYLLWPALFVLTRRFRLRFIGAAVILLTLLRFYAVFEWHITGRLLSPLLEYPLYRMDTFLIGGAFAIARWTWVNKIPAELFFLSLVLWFPFSLNYLLLQPVSTPVSAFLICALLDWLIHSKGLCVRLLSVRPLVLIGELSYSLYLWQQMLIKPGHPNWWSALLPVVAALSFYAVERPALRMKNYSPLLRPITTRSLAVR